MATSTTTATSEFKEMTKLLTDVEFAPNETLKFKYYGKFRGDYKELILYNPTDKMVAFKLKGTSPKMIKITPGYGYLKPEGRVAIWVIVKPTSEGEPPSNAHVTVLLSLIPEKHSENPRKFWKRKPPHTPLWKQIELKFVKKSKPISKKKSKSPPPEEESEKDDDDKEDED